MRFVFFSRVCLQQRVHECRSGPCTRHHARCAVHTRWSVTQGMAHARVLACPAMQAPHSPPISLSLHPCCQARTHEQVCSPTRVRACACPLLPRSRSRAASENAVATFTFQLVSGGVAAACSRTLVAPLERIKIVMQVQVRRACGHCPAAGGTERASPQHMYQSPDAKRFRGVLHALRAIPKHEGVRGFWHGNGVNVLRCAVVVPSDGVHRRQALLTRACSPAPQDRPQLCGEVCVI